MGHSVGLSKGEAAETFARGTFPGVDQHRTRPSTPGWGSSGQCGPELAPSWPAAFSDAARRPQTL
eukprot:1339427-Prymnesium_polylepis.1